MPIYEYRCRACGFQKEFLQRLNEAPQTKCPECGKRTLSKLVTAAGFHLKGTGWYATDFKNSGAKPAAKGKASEPAKEASSKDASSKDASSKDASSKDTSSKDTSSKDTSSKDAKGKETSGKEAAKSDSKPSAGASPARN